MEDIEKSNMSDPKDSTVSSVKKESASEGFADDKSSNSKLLRKVTLKSSAVKKIPSDVIDEIDEAEEKLALKKLSFLNRKPCKRKIKLHFKSGSIGASDDDDAKDVRNKNNIEKDNWNNISSCCTNKDSMVDIVPTAGTTKEELRDFRLSLLSRNNDTPDDNKEKDKGEKFKKTKEKSADKKREVGEVFEKVDIDPDAVVASLLTCVKEGIQKEKEIRKAQLIKIQDLTQTKVFAETKEKERKERERKALLEDGECSSGSTSSSSEDGTVQPGDTDGKKDKKKKKKKRSKEKSAKKDKKKKKSIESRH